MDVAVLRHRAYMMHYNLPLVTSADRNSPVGLFSPDIFGVTEKDKFTKTAMIALNCTIVHPNILNILNRIQRKMYMGCIDSTVVMVLRNGRIFLENKGYKAEGDEEVGMGPSFLYRIWDKLDLSIFKKEYGTESNKDMNMAMLRYTKEEIFQTHIFVCSVGYREEDTDSAIVSNQMNVHYSTIIRLSNLIQGGILGGNREDIIIRVQSEVLALFKLVSDANIGPKAKFRKANLSRAMDFASRAVLMSTSYNASRYCNNTPNSIRTTGLPIQFAIHNYHNSFVSYSKAFLENLYAMGLMGDDKIVLQYYDNEFWKTYMEKFEDQYMRVQPFPIFNVDGTTRPLILDFELFEESKEMKKKKPKNIKELFVSKGSEQKYLSWIEFFYIVGYTYLKLKDGNRALANTRYPTDSLLSTQMQTPYLTTLTPTLLKTVKILDDFYPYYFPYVNDDVASKYNQEIFEAVNRNTNSATVGWNGDYDGDMVNKIPVNSKEAVAEAKRVGNNLLNIFDVGGNFARSIGKDGAQTIFTFTRDARKYDDNKHIKNPDSDEFIQYLLSYEDGMLDCEYFYDKTTDSYNIEENKLIKAKYSIYDTFEYKRGKDKMVTTIGRFVLQKTIFYHMFNDINVYEYINKPIYNSDIGDIFKGLSQYVFEGVYESSQLVDCTDSYCEFVMRFSTLYNASINSDMLMSDEVMDKYRDDKLKELKDKALKEDRDITPLDMIEFESDCIEFAKKHFVDTEMYELYISKNSMKWDNDFKSMNISMGALPNLTGGKPIILTKSLYEGFDFEDIPHVFNVGCSGAVARGVYTEKGQWLFINYFN